MKTTWSVFQFGHYWSKSDEIQNESILRLIASGFETEKEAEQWIEFPNNAFKGEFVILKVFEIGLHK